jgi:hypothetical protein
VKLYIKAAGRWNGVKVGESFDDLEKNLNNLQKIVSTIKKFKMPNKIVLDYDVVDAGAGKTNASPLHIDYDRTGDVSSGTDINTALDIDLNVTGASSGTITSTGAQIDVVGDSGGTSTARGLGIDVTGADTNEGIRIETPDGSADIVMMSPNNSDDYCSISVSAEGATTIATNDDDTAVGHLTLDADGDIIMKWGSATGQIDFTNENSGDGVIQQKVDAKDLVVQQYDGDEVVRFTDAGDVKVSTIVYFHAERANVCDSSSGAAIVGIDWNLSQKQRVTITGTSNTINFTNPPSGACNLMLKVIQGDGSDTASWDSDIKWAGGSAPTLSSSSGDIDILSFYWDGTNYFGVVSHNFD